MLTNAFTAIAPAGYGDTGGARMQGSALPGSALRPWTRQPGIAAPCADRLLGATAGVTGGAMPAVAFVEPAVVPSRVARFRAVQHVIDLNNLTDTTLGNHSPGRPQS